MDRTKAPKVAAIADFDFLKAKSEKLDNGIQLHYIDGGDQEVVRVEMLFDAGYHYQNLSLQAAAVNYLLTEGTEKYSAAEIASKFESKGAFLENTFEADFAGLSMHCLSRHLDELFPIMLELSQNSVFPEDEIVSFKQLKKQKFLVNQEKVSFLAKNYFATAIFGEEHPYNNVIAEADFDLLQRDRLEEFFQNHYQNRPFQLFISGKVNDKVIKTIKTEVEGWKLNPKQEQELDFVANPMADKSVLIERPSASQSAIRLGAASISKRHPDFPALYFVNTILGGYFGSRLMSNLREDKGFTYGVGSGMISYQKAAYFFIATEVGAEHTQTALTEVEKEVNRLRTEPVSEEELSTVRNYLLGSVMRNFDGPFSAMDRFKSLQANQIDYTYYTNLAETFKTIDSNKLLTISNKYLNFNKFREVIAGKI